MVTSIGRGAKPPLFLFLARDCKSVAYCLSQEFFVEVCVVFLKGCAIKSACWYCLVSDYVRASFKFFNISFQQFFFQAFFEELHLCFGFFHQLFPFVQCFNFCDKFISTHFVFSFWCVLFFLSWLYYTLDFSVFQLTNYTKIQCNRCANFTLDFSVLL